MGLVVVVTKALRLTKTMVERVVDMRVGAEVAVAMAVGGGGRETVETVGVEVAAKVMVGMEGGVAVRTVAHT